MVMETGRVGGMEMSDVKLYTLNGLFFNQIVPHHLRFLRSLVYKASLDCCLFRPLLNIQTFTILLPTQSSYGWKSDVF